MQRTRSLQRTLLLYLVPALGAATLLYAVLLYDTLQQRILEGFDRKLRSISVVSAAFINGDEHTRLAERAPLRGLFWHPELNRPAAFHPNRRVLSVLELETGGISDELALSGEIPAGAELSGLAFNPAAQQVFLSWKGMPVVQSFNLRERVVRTVTRLRQPVRGLAWIAKPEGLYAVAESSLIRIDAGSGTVAALGDFPLESAVLTASPSPNEILAVDTESGDLYTFDVVNGSLVREGKLALDGDEEQAAAEIAGSASGEQQDVPMGAFTFPIRGVALSPDSRTLYAISDQLLRVNLDTLSVQAANYSPGFRNEELAAYREYAGPMHRIIQTTGLTYHYSLIPFGDSDIMYVIDGTEGDDHSPIGTRESNPEEEAARLWHVMRTGEVSLSDIQEFDLWGLLKIGSAAIRDAAGRPVGLVGADVNISVIRAKTSQALLHVILLGLGALIGALLISLVIGEGLRAPILTLKDFALRAGSNEQADPPQISSPAELRDLAGVLIRLRDRMTESAGTLRIEADRGTEQRGRRGLIRVLSEEGARPAEHSNEDAGPPYLCGELQVSEFALLWAARRSGEPLADARLWSDASHLLRSAAERDPELFRARLPELAELLPEEIAGLVVVDRGAGAIRFLPARSGSSKTQRRESAVLEYPGLSLGDVERIMLVEEARAGRVGMVVFPGDARRRKGEVIAELNIGGRDAHR